MKLTLLQDFAVLSYACLYKHMQENLVTYPGNEVTANCISLWTPNTSACLPRNHSVIA